MMGNNHVHLEGVVSYINGEDFILLVDENFILCRGECDVPIGTPTTVDGTLRSRFVVVTGRKITLFYVERIS